MSGYTPVFGSIFTGTLCGKYPDTAAWLYFLALADKNGIVDMTPQYISTVTGMPVDDLLGCIERFESPDASSRTSEEDGRRLVRVDSTRAWGWRIVNHGKYREKARLMAKAASEIESGKNAARMADRRRPPETAADPLSDSDAYSDSNKDKEGREERFAPPPGLDWESFSKWEGYRAQIGKPLAPASILAAQRKLVAFGADQAAVVEQSIANGWHGLFHLKKDRAEKSANWVPPKSIAELEAEEAARGQR